MNGFLRRIRRLKEELKGPEIPPVTVVYTDGSEREMEGTAAFHEICTNKDVVEVRCLNPEAQSFWDALRPGFDCAELWSDTV